ncbi:N-acetyltransferase [Synechococcus sp. BA-132 BA5]|uniref:N-acetyltransferase n=1 Tax=Synechococcus sp. BA-132 BA5 TaxID=3110252 RepID=UPI002B1FCAAA|nr:N-acetyltransferase [Synechococcus sp. BA-132 BA5]MEA5415731.1 N-acetyltransferase [Synechococcus sp. BA-132 BA5]
MIPFRSQPPTPRLREGYALLHQQDLEAAGLNRLLEACGDAPRSTERWQRVLARSAWHLVVLNPRGQLVGFVRATSDQALNANLWDLVADPADPCRDEVIGALVQAALARLRRELSGCSISLSAPPEALEALARAGFVVDPGGIRAMGLDLRADGDG